jgi:hypothetical protein
MVTMQIPYDLEFVENRPLVAAKVVALQKQPTVWLGAGAPNRTRTSSTRCCSGCTGWCGAWKRRARTVVVDGAERQTVVAAAPRPPPSKN